MIGPSNPVISIGPILAVPGMREAIAASGAPVVAVSPLVAGRAVKGPTDAFIAAVGRPVTAAGVASLYAGLIDGDGRRRRRSRSRRPDGVAVLSCPTLMEGADGRRGARRAGARVRRAALASRRGSAAAMTHDGDHSR